GVLGTLGNEDGLPRTDSVRHPLDPGLATPLQHIQDLLGAVNMADGGAGIERQAVGHHVQSSQVTIDQPLQRPALQGKTADLTLMAQARPLLHGHSGAPIIAMARTLTISTKGWTTARSDAPECECLCWGWAAGDSAVSARRPSCLARGRTGRPPLPSWTAPGMPASTISIPPTATGVASRSRSSAPG